MDLGLRSAARNLFRTWAKFGKAPGLRYVWIQKYGPRLAGSQPLVARLPNGCVVECDIREEVARQIYFSGIYESVDAYLFCRLLRPGMTILDVGGNLGQYSLLSATAVGAQGSVHSFEPVPSNFERLSRNIRNNGLENVHLNQAAAWNEATTLTLELPSDSRDNAGSFQVSNPSGTTSGGFEAKSIRLDDYVREQALGRVDLVKMDIEGAEVHALEGATEMIRRDHPLILMEVNRPALEALGSSPSRLMEIVRTHGYRAWHIATEPSRCRPLDDFEEFGQGNVLLHRDDLPADVTGGWSLKSANRWGCRRL